MTDGAEQLSKPQLIDLVRQQLKRIDQLEARIVQLEAENARLKKNSSNSSKPPSSDIVKPKLKPLPGKKRKRKIGGQPGHLKHKRTPFAPDELDDTHDYTLDACPTCGGALLDAAIKPRIIQQIELIDKPVTIIEHRAMAHWCPCCKKIHRASLPQAVQRGGLVGPRMTALVAYLKGGCHASYSTTQAFLRDVLQTRISRGQLARLTAKTTAALDEPYRQILAALPDEKRLNIDETGHKEFKKRLWTWCFRAPRHTLFKIDPSRGSKVLVDVLGENFSGVIGCDYFSAYRKYAADFNVDTQYCMAHLIRDVRALTVLGKADIKYGERLLDHLRKMFSVIHRRDSMEPQKFERALEKIRKDFLWAATHPPWTSGGENMATRFRKHRDSYFRFVTTPDVEPTNNSAEQAIRYVVIDRRVTQGTRGDAGQRWCECIWTTTATCAQQGRSVFEFLDQAIAAYFTNQPAPSLLIENV